MLICTRSTHSSHDSVNSFRLTLSLDKLLLLLVARSSLEGVWVFVSLDVPDFFIAISSISAALVLTGVGNLTGWLSSVAGSLDVTAFGGLVVTLVGVFGASTDKEPLLVPLVSDFLLKYSA